MSYDDYFGSEGLPPRRATLEPEDKDVDPYTGLTKSELELAMETRRCHLVTLANTMIRTLSQRADLKNSGGEMIGGMAVRAAIKTLNDIDDNVEFYYTGDV